MDTIRSVSGCPIRLSPVLSADLAIRDERFLIAALGPEHVVLRAPRAVAAGKGTIHFRLDDRLTIYHIDLPDGINPNRREQFYRLLETVEV